MKKRHKWFPVFLQYGTQGDGLPITLVSSICGVTGETKIFKLEGNIPPEFIKNATPFRENEDIQDGQTYNHVNLHRTETLQ